MLLIKFSLGIFLSTLSLRRATVLAWCSCGGAFDFYPRSPCGERRVHYDNYNLHCVISIHALLAESDQHGCAGDMSQRISIHALLAESDPGKVNSVLPGLAFLSTLSLRRATIDIRDTVLLSTDFYPRSPCGERLTPIDSIIDIIKFLSTLSLRRATSGHCAQ